ncbi:TRAP transporter large permease [Salicibibacter kimchii]|uniref:TRAP transporter large permease n=1 Tax=Salicibibacter kimchii TaxID=2099786 RepID=A0A345BWG5_9BACI|nr:TRAP transporter large permease [Salicibibacter kimchii]AXF55296.1 TRAP transporter large permease [Salicibibacter kimchii]
MTILLVSLAIFLAVSVPIAITLGLSSLLLMQVNDISWVTMAQNTFESINSFTLLAIPFFILAGHIMQVGGISERLMDFASALLSWVRGGVGSVAVLTTMIFSTMSGSSSATTAAISPTMIPAMEKKGYPKRFAAATSASAGELGSVIPPAINMIVLGMVANISIGSLFLAGIIPGIMVGLSLIIVVMVIAKIKDFDPVTKVDKVQWFKNVLKTFADAFFALLMPAIILGGIYMGWFTPTEAAVIAVVYGLIVSLLIYRDLKLKDLFPIFKKAAFTSSIIMIIVAFAGIFGHILTTERVPHQLGEFIGSITENPIIFLLLANIMLLVIGMFIEAIAAIVIIVPILAPLAADFGIDPIHFGMIMILNLAIGMITPPVGVNLYVACQVANLRIEQIIRPVSIFFGVLIVNLLLVTYLPVLSTWLPSLGD